MEYNLRKLDPIEFEKLSKDIMNYYYKLENTFTRGKVGQDGGIDLLSNDGKILVQCKHYINSKYSNLKTAVKQEINRRDFKKIEKYFIITSLELKIIEMQEVKRMFERMNFQFEIIDGIQIDDLLVENPDIVKGNIKLWITPYYLENIYKSKLVSIGTEIMLSEIEQNLKYFVETHSFYEAQKLLLDSNCIIIVGHPGVGKTTISNMLALILNKYSGYSIHYSQGTDIDEIINSISDDPTKKELFYLDDFLGTIYLELYNNSLTNKIKTLISVISRNSNKKLILNSRITILNEAKEINDNFKDCIDNIKNITINVDEMTVNERALILYKYLYYNNIDIEKIKYIIDEKRYLRIIDHKYYNPRIIAKVVSNNTYIDDPKEFYEDIINNLNNPHLIWKNEYEKRLQEEDRILLNILYSISRYGVKYSILEECFSNFIKDNNTIDKSKDIFKETISRLNESMIKVVVSKQEKLILPINPSVSDFLKNNISTITAIDIVKKSLYIEQVESMLDINNQLLELCDINLTKLKSLNSLGNENAILRVIGKYKIYDYTYKNIVSSVLDKQTLAFKSEYRIVYTVSRMLNEIIINKKLREFYEIDIISNLDTCIKIMDSSYLYKFFEEYKDDVYNRFKEEKEIYIAYLNKYQIEIDEKFTENLLEDIYVPEEFYEDNDYIFNEIEHGIERKLETINYLNNEFGISVNIDKDEIYDQITQTFVKTEENINKESEKENLEKSKENISKELEDIFCISNFQKIER